MDRLPPALLRLLGIHQGNRRIVSIPRRIVQVHDHLRDSWVVTGTPPAIRHTRRRGQVRPATEIGVREDWLNPMPGGGKL